MNTEFNKMYATYMNERAVIFTNHGLTIAIIFRCDAGLPCVVLFIVDDVDPESRNPS